MKGRNDFDPKSNVAKSLYGRLFYDASANATTSSSTLNFLHDEVTGPVVSWRRSQLGSNRVSFVTRSRLRGNTIVIVSMERLCFRSNEERSSFVNGAWLRFPGNLNPECRSVANRRMWIC